MKIDIAVKSKFLIIRFYGELDMNTAPKFKEKIENNLKEKELNNIILNLNRMKFIDSTGIGAILGRYKAIKNSNGKMIIVGVNERVKKIFKISGIYDLIKFYDSEKNAISENKGGK